jgi:hypothetical protein
MTFTPARKQALLSYWLECRGITDGGRCLDGWQTKIVEAYNLLHSVSRNVTTNPSYPRRRAEALKLADLLLRADRAGVTPRHQLLTDTVVEYSSRRGIKAADITVHRDKYAEAWAICMAVHYRGRKKTLRFEEFLICNVSEPLLWTALALADEVEDVEFTQWPPTSLQDNGVHATK